MSRRLRRAATALLLGATLLQPASAAAQPTGGFTDVRIDGSTAVIVVNIDVIYAPGDNYGPPSPEFVELADAGFAAAQRFWNDAFERQGCPKLRLELNVEYETSESSDVDGHIVYPYSSFRAGTFPDGRGLPTVEFPSLPPDTPGDVDVTDPYDHAAVAYMPPWLFEDPWALAHELGHLFGLGDDYRDGEILPGRDGTLMGGTLGGDYVDRSIVNDIAAVIGDAGYQIPDCESWTGTMHLAFDGNVASDPDTPCTGEADLELTVTVDSAGAVTGSGDVTGAPYICVADGIEAPGPNPSGPFTVSGTKTDAAFDLQLVPGQGTACCAAWPGDVFLHAVVPLETPVHAEADISSDSDGGIPWVGSLTLSVELDCTSCAVT